MITGSLSRLLVAFGYQANMGEEGYRDVRIQPGKMVTSLELLQSMDSDNGSTEPEAVLDSKHWWHLPEKTSDHR